MHAYDPAAWAGFFTAMTGASAALAGLLFVSVSINLDRIIPVRKDAGTAPAGDQPPGEDDQPAKEVDTMLATRAGETLAVLIFVVLAAALALVPQNLSLLGAELLVMAVPMSAITLRSQVRYWRRHPEQPLYWTVSRITLSGAGLFPGIVAGVSLAARWGGGFYWLVPTTLLGITGAVFSAWVLLVEILR